MSRMNREEEGMKQLSFAILLVGVLLVALQPFAQA